MIFLKKILLFLFIITLITITIPTCISLKYGKYKEPLPESQEVLSVYVKAVDKVVDMNKEQYLKEVVAAEMPADFHIEALKAQAVAARSYLDSRLSAYKKSGNPPEHKGADICTDSAHCKAWISMDDRIKSWGKNGQSNWEKISRAVTETSGQIITYNNEVISAVFHSTSSGRTENSKDVWGGERPYLVSVESPGDLYSPKLKSEKTISLDDFKKTISENVENVDFNKELIGEINRSEAGGIITVSVGGVEIKGSKLRSLFNLRSANINININGDTVNFDVTGYGHGVGMSQYGANHLAHEGKDYVEILKTYYQGVEVE